MSVSVCIQLLFEIITLDFTALEAAQIIVWGGAGCLECGAHLSSVLRTAEPARKSPNCCSLRTQPLLWIILPDGCAGFCMT